MSGKHTELEALGTDLARAQDAVLEANPPPELNTRAAPSSAGWRWIVAATALAGAGAAAVFVFQRSRPLTVEIDGKPAGDPSAWISVGASGETPIRFSDGSTLLLVGDGRTRMVGVTSHGAHVQVERGRAVVSVVHREGARWMLDVGPFTVEVTGTRFEVNWDAAAEAFSLTMQEGSVHVRGPGLEDRVLVAGQSIVQRLGAATVAKPQSPVAPAPTTAASPLAAPIETTHAAPVAAARPIARPKPSVVPPAPVPMVASAPTPSGAAMPVAPLAPPAPALQELYNAGRYREALAAVRASGAEKTLGASNADELLLVADTARLAGDPTFSRQALEATRHRFPGSPAAAHASFMLGRLAFDIDARPAAAARFFEQYLTEAPNGPLAREALGRLVESLESSGERPAAETRAKQYLDQYPSGPHAALARSLLSR